MNDRHDTLDTGAAARPPDIGRLFDLHARRLRVAMYALCGNAAAADEVVQRTFLEAWERRGALYDSPAVYGWLYRKAYFLMKHYWREEAKFDKVGSVAHEVAPDVPPSAEQALTQRQRNALVHAHIARLPEAYRDAVVLSGCGGLEAPEIAEILGVPVNTVYVRLHRGKRLLLERVGRLPDAPARAVPDAATAVSTWAWLAAFLPPELVAHIGTTERVDEGLRRLASESGGTVDRVLAEVGRLDDDARAAFLLGRVLRMTDRDVAEILDVGVPR